MPSVTVNRVNIKYETRGAGEAVALVHLSLYADSYAPLMDQPTLVGYRLIRYHRRGDAGSSRTAGPVTIADQAADLARLLDILGVERAYVAGHSYGGLIATPLTLTRPDLVGPSCLWSQRYGSYPEDRPVGTWAGGWLWVSRSTRRVTELEPPTAS